MTYEAILSRLKDEGNLRKLPEEMPVGMTDFSSNDYLGIANDENLSREFLNTLDKSGKHFFSSSASRLLLSLQSDYKELESFLESHYGKPALLFNSGYHANTGILPALVTDSKSLIVADKLVHASIIDGIVLSRAEFRRFPHNDMKALRKIIESNNNDFERIIVVTESVFSMDGDKAPLDKFLELKKEFPKIILYLDEAHAFGVKGDKGLGLARNFEDPSDPEKCFDIIVCPLGKAAASMGAFVICNGEIKDLLVNKSRSLIFSTALPPVQVCWTRFVFERILGMEEERKHLHDLSIRLDEIIRKYSPAQPEIVSHIHPLIIGDSHKTLEISRLLYNQGIKAMPIRKPTVPGGTERIRFSLSASMTFDDLDKLASALSTR